MASLYMMAGVTSRHLGWGRSGGQERRARCGVTPTELGRDGGGAASGTEACYVPRTLD